MTFVLVTYPTEERWTFLNLPTPAGSMAKDFPYAMADGRSSFFLVLAYAGLIHRDGADGNGRVLLVYHQRHDLDVLKPSNRFSVEVGNELVRSKPRLPCRALLVDILIG